MNLIRELIFPLDDELEDEINIKRCRFDVINLAIMKRINELLIKKNEKEKSPYSKLAGVLSKCLCSNNINLYLNLHSQ